MVLDTYDKDNDVLIFKNTYDDPENGQTKQIKVRRTDPNTPEELYFVHLQIKDMDNLPGQKERAAIKKSEKKRQWKPVFEVLLLPRNCMLQPNCERIYDLSTQLLC